MYRFFTESLLPLLTKFKEERMSWSYMLTEGYTDERVVEEFSQAVVQRVNKSFRAYCRST